LQKKRKANAKLILQIPRAATADFCKVLQRYWYTMFGVSLSVFDTDRTLAATGLMPTVRAGKGAPEGAFERLGALTTPNFCGIASDQCQKQITGLTCLAERLRLNFEHLFDPSHRYHNNYNEALTRSGLLSKYYAAIPVYNVLYGPFQSSSWFHLAVQHGADQTVSMKPDDPLLLRCWQEILLDGGYHNVPGASGKKAREQYIKEKFAHQKAVSLHGEKVKPSRWGSWHHAFDGWDAELHTRGLLMAKVCLHKGWALTAEDVFTPMKNLPLEVQAAVPKAEPSKAAAKRTAKAHVDTLLKKAKNAFIAGTKVIFDRDEVNAQRLIGMGLRPLYTEMMENTTDLKGADSSRAFYIGHADWGFLNMCKATIRTRTDTANLERAGFTLKFTEKAMAGMTDASAQMRYERNLAQTFYDLTFSSVRAQVGSFLLHTDSYPALLAGLLEERLVVGTLTRLAADVKALHLARDARLINY
jgi:hypothetical protein